MRVAALSLPAMLAMMAPVVSQAQDWNNLAASEAINQVHSAMRENMIVAPAEERAGRRGTVPNAPGKHARVAADYNYAVNPVVRRKVEQDLVAGIARSDKAAAAQLSKALGQQNLIAAYDRAARPMGLQSGTIINAIASFRLVMWTAAMRAGAAPTKPAIDGVRRQVEAGLDLAAGGLTSPERRQYMAESLLYQAILIDMAMEEAEKNDNKPEQQKIAAAARQALLRSGLNPEKVQLTDKGFVPIR